MNYLRRVPAGQLSASEMAEHFAKLRPPFAPHERPRVDAATLGARPGARDRRATRRRACRPASPATAAGLTGMEPGIPGLVGLRPTYIAAQLTRWRVGERHAAEPDCMKRIASRLSDADIAGGRGMAGAAASRRRILARVVQPRAHAARVRQPAVSRCADVRFAIVLVVAGRVVAAACCVWSAAAPRHAARAAGRARLERDHAGHQRRASTWRAPATASPATPRRAASEFAGGRAMPTPFGNLYVPNITPDDETGIGQWTADEFYRMMHTGISRDGTLLYPAMPFASYTKVTREDSDAIYAYLMSVPPVKQQNRPHELRFPFNKRELLVGWRALYFKEGEYVPDPEAVGAVEPRRLPRARASATARCATRRSTRSAARSEVEGVRGRDDPEPELVRAVADLEPRGGPRRLEHQGHHRPAAGRRLAPRHRVRADGRGRLQQPAVPDRRGRRGDGRVPQGAAAARRGAAADEPGAAGRARA